MWHLICVVQLEFLQEIHAKVAQEIFFCMAMHIFPTTQKLSLFFFFFSPPVHCMFLTY